MSGDLSLFDLGSCSWAGPGFGESVDGLDRPGVGGVVKAIEPFADLVGVSLNYATVQITGADTT